MSASTGLASSEFDAADSEGSAVLCEVMHNDGHWAVQSHPRSPMWIPIESPYVTSY